MMSSSTDATTASRQVEYPSASQCSRLFRSTPSRDIARLREPGGQELATL